MDGSTERLGLLAGLSNDEHHADPAIGASGLKLLEQSPLHYWDAYINPEREKREPTLAMRMGTAWHTAVFEPQEFSSRYATGHDVHPATKCAKLLAAVLAGETRLEQLVELPEGLTGTSKEGKALIAEIEADGNTPVTPADHAFVLEWHPKLVGREVMSPDDMDRIRAMAVAARSHPASRILFSQPGHAEASIFWRDPETGLRCKIRPDWVVHPCQLFPHGLIVDGKSTEDASGPEFARQAFNLEYALQAAWYVDGYQRAMGTDQPPAFIWLVQEKARPFAIAVYSCGDDLLAYGRRKYRRLLRLLARCHATKTWPGYPEAVQPLEVPAWAQKQIDHEAAAA